MKIFDEFVGSTAPYFFTANAHEETRILEPFDEECSLRKSEMSKVVLFIATSLDGYITSPDNTVDWPFHDAEYGYTEFMAFVSQTKRISTAANGKLRRPN